MDDCVFCKIIRGEIPCFKVYEDENFLAFLDINPIKPGHTLLIPKKHTDYVFDLNDNEYSELMLKAKEVANKLKVKLNPKRIGIAVEGFGVPHAHIHLVPINKGHDLNPTRAKPAKLENLQKIAKVILG